MRKHSYCGSTVQEIYKYRRIIKMENRVETKERCRQSKKFPHNKKGRPGNIPRLVLSANGTPDWECANSKFGSAAFGKAENTWNAYKLKEKRNDWFEWVVCERWSWIGQNECAREQANWWSFLIFGLFFANHKATKNSVIRPIFVHWTNPDVKTKTK